MPLTVFQCVGHEQQRTSDLEHSFLLKPNIGHTIIHVTVCTKYSGIHVHGGELMLEINCTLLNTGCAI